MKVRIALSAEQRDMIRRQTGQEVRLVTLLLEEKPQGTIAPQPVYPIDEISLPMVGR